MAKHLLGSSVVRYFEDNRTALRDTVKMML